MAWKYAVESFNPHYRKPPFTQHHVMTFHASFENSERESDLFVIFLQNATNISQISVQHLLDT